MADPLRIGVTACCGWAIIALLVQILHARSYGKRPLYAPPAGNSGKAVLYAFGPGMSPAAKESVREHLPTYAIGLATHFGIFASFAYLALTTIGANVDGAISMAARVAGLMGAVGGGILLVRRLASHRLRGLSSPDDYVANLLTTAFAALVFASTLNPAARPILMAESMALCLYIPLGKIRHCCFFFTTRSATAAQFGRRGTLPPVRATGRG